MTRAGIVAVVGKPNAGKSTLLNRLVGEKLSITSDEAAVHARSDRRHPAPKDDVQMVLLDTPGLLEPQLRAPALHARRIAPGARRRRRHRLPRRRHATAPRRRSARRPSSSATRARPFIAVFNKVDALSAPARDALPRAAPDGASHLRAHRRRRGRARSRDHASTCPRARFSIPTTRSARSRSASSPAELVRETALEQLEDEVPYSVACEIEEFREDRSPVYIRAVIYVERESQKGILVGQKGARIRELGSRIARRRSSVSSAARSISTSG